jgi:hypothetical protein
MVRDRILGIAVPNTEVATLADFESEKVLAHAPEEGERIQDPDQSCEQDPKDAYAVAKAVIDPDKIRLFYLRVVEESLVYIGFKPFWVVSILGAINVCIMDGDLEC